jgi:hypothetical protein
MPIAEHPWRSSKRALDQIIPTWPLASTTLAGLLRATNRLAEAEPLFRRVLRILAAFGYRTGHEHPHFHTASNNYAALLGAMGLNEDEILAHLRSAIEGN